MGAVSAFTTLNQGRLNYHYKPLMTDVIVIHDKVNGK